jgi:pyruvate dehydrogenase E1 component
MKNKKSPPKQRAPKLVGSSGGSSSSAELDYELLYGIVDRAYYMALEMIHAANHREVKEKGEPKVGGHPSACASSKHILAAIHLVMRKPEDYFAFKPHISPMDHALNLLMHNFREKDGSLMELDRRKIAMKHLRHYSPEGEPVFQSYHAEADPDGFRFFPSGSVGIPPVNALYMALAYEFAKDHGVEIPEDPTFWCLMGDSEFREGSLMEAMPDAGERQLKRMVWIVDYNRQNLDGTRIINEKAMGGTDAERILTIAKANGWNPILLKHGKIREALFAKPGGKEFQRVLDEALSDFELQGLLASKDIKLIRTRLNEKSSDLKKFLSALSDEELYKAFFNLAGHDLQSLVEAFEKAQASEGAPTMIVAYTIKGHGLECQAMSGNHSAMPEREEIDRMAERLGCDTQDPFAEFPEDSAETAFLRTRKEKVTEGIQQLIQDIESRRQSFFGKAREIEWPVDFDITALKFAPVAHTQWMWGQIAAKLDRLGHGNAPSESATEQAWAKVAQYFVTMAPDVGSSTNTSPNMNQKIYGDIGQEDFEALFNVKDSKAPDVVPSETVKSGHIRFEIAEGNCMSAVGSFGKMGPWVGVPYYPAMTIYDFFIKRCHDQLYYNIYWHSHFATMGTPSGVTLAPEGAQHSWKSDFQMPNCITWEPFFAKELEWILADTLKRHFTGEDADREAATIRCVTKGVVQKELFDRTRRQYRFKAQPPAAINRETEAQVPAIADSEILETIRQEALQGAYALVDYRGYEDYRPGDNVVHLFAMGALGTEAIRASDLLLEKGIYANVFIVTSPDLLLGNYAYNDRYQHLKQNLGVSGNLYLHPERGTQLQTIADFYSLQSARVPIVSVHDGEPGLLDNIGSIVGVKQKTLAIRKTSKSGTTWDIFHYHGIDAESVAEASIEILKDAAEERFVLPREVVENLGESVVSEPDGASSPSPYRH